MLDGGNWATVAQSVATQSVNAGVVSSNPSSANILSNVWLWHASHVFHQWANKLCEKAATGFESMLCGVMVWESRSDMTEKLLKTEWNVNQSSLDGGVLSKYWSTFGWETLIKNGS